MAAHAGGPCPPLRHFDQIDGASPDAAEDAARLADALVTDPPHQVAEAHWNEEAKALLARLILHIAADEPPPRRNLATLRELITLPTDRFERLLVAMQDDPAAGGLVARAANRHLAKDNREASGVRSAAQRHTHFLDSPRAHDRGDGPLRLRLRRAEAAHRDRLPGAAAGSHRWPAMASSSGPILQDLHQLRGTYGTHAGTFLSNAGLVQVFNVNDTDTAEWVSRALG